MSYYTCWFILLIKLQMRFQIAFQMNIRHISYVPTVFRRFFFFTTYIIFLVMEMILLVVIKTQFKKLEIDAEIIMTQKEWKRQISKSDTWHIISIARHYLNAFDQWYETKKLLWHTNKQKLQSVSGINHNIKYCTSTFFFDVSWPENLSLFIIFFYILHYFHIIFP